MAGIVLAILAISIAQSAARDIDYCYAYDNNPYLLLGTKTAYEFVYGRSRISPIPNCRPVQIWLLARHGTRYPNRGFIKRVPKLINLRDEIINEKAQFGRLCNADLETLRNWRPNVNMNITVSNHLTSQGEQDLKLLARRLQIKFPELLRPAPQNINSENYKFRATKTQRTQASMEFFMEGLFDRKNAVTVEQPPEYDMLFRTYKHCAAWNASIEKDHVYTEAEKFIAGPEYQNLIANVSRRLGFNDPIDNDLIKLMYDVCRYEKAWNINQLSPWCTVFSKDELVVLEYLEDIEYYYYSGPGREINGQLACLSLKDLFKHFKNLEHDNNEPKGVFYFAHSVTVQVLLNALGINSDSTPLLADNFQSMKNRRFRTSTLGAFASNLVAVFYKCNDTDSPNKVILYLNEKPVLMDGCNVGLCDWDYLKARFGKTAEECTLDFCNGVTTIAGYGFSIGLALTLVVRSIS